jgi:hypothetical protein
MIKKLISNKLIIAFIVIAMISLILEIFVFNLSSFKSIGYETQTLASNVSTDEEYTYYTDTFTVNGPVVNVDVDMDVENYEIGYVSVILTDEGDKYEYVTPEYTVCNGIRRSGFSNIYPFGDVHTIQVKVRAEEGCIAHIRSISINEYIPVDIKPIRLIVIFMILMMGYLVFTQSPIHNIFLDEKKIWQWVVTLLVLICFIMLGRFINRADKILLDSPWPHHSQYQELARNLEKGTVEMTEQYVDPALLEVENPYDTITLLAENIPYSMDYAFYNGHYYSYFGIVPELLLYYPYRVIKKADLPNYKAMYAFYVLLVVGVFLTITGFLKRYVKSIPYVWYIAVTAVMLLSANFIYLTARSDIYNIPIMGAVAFSFMGQGLWLNSLNAKNPVIKKICIFFGSLSMALVAGCRPQLLLLSGVALIWFIFEDGIKNRKLFTKKSIIDTICFCLPYIIVAIPVCWYNYARFGNIFDFGATYSLTTNDMNHRGFNFDRLIRSLYCFLFQPPTVNTVFPFLEGSKVDGNYMGRFLCEYTYGGILTANAFMVSLWVMLATGLKKIERPIRQLIIYLCICAVIVAGFDANGAGVLYRYTCDFAPLFILASAVLWLVYLDKGRNVIEYKHISRLAYICIILSVTYAFLTFIASGSVISLENDNRILFNAIADYFKI